MPLSPETCSNLRLSLSEIEAKHVRLVALLAEINITGSSKLFIEAQELKREIEADFEAIPNLKTIEFLKTFEGEYTLHTFDLVPKTGDQYIAELRQAGMPLYGEAQHLLETMPMLKELEQFEIVVIKISDLGFTSNPTRDEVYKKVKELDLNFCPPQIGPEYRLKYQDQPLGEVVFIGMESIDDQYGVPRFFILDSGSPGLALDSDKTRSSNEWGLDSHVAFRLGK